MSYVLLSRPVVLGKKFSSHLLMVDSDWKSIYLTIQVQFVRYKLFSFLVKYFYD